jgi:hypothetical protein
VIAIHQDYAQWQKYLVYLQRVAIAMLLVFLIEPFIKQYTDLRPLGILGLAVAWLIQTIVINPWGPSGKKVSQVSPNYIYVWILGTLGSWLFFPSIVAGTVVSPTLLNERSGPFVAVGGAVGFIGILLADLMNDSRYFRRRSAP